MEFDLNEKTALVRGGGYSGMGVYVLGVNLWHEWAFA